jgi:hypothetical protein
MQRALNSLLLLLLLLGASVHAATPKPAAKAPARPVACVPDEPSFWKDQGLTTKLSAKLQFHKPLFGERVQAKVSGNAAILSGNVSTQKLIDEAVRTAAAVGGIKCVQNYLQVGPPLPQPQQ